MVSGFATYRGGLSSDPGSWSPNVQKSRYAVVVRAFESNSPHMYIDPISTYLYAISQNFL